MVRDQGPLRRGAEEAWGGEGAPTTTRLPRHAMPRYDHAMPRRAIPRYATPSTRLRRGEDVRLVPIGAVAAPTGDQCAQVVHEDPQPRGRCRRLPCLVTLPVSAARPVMTRCADARAADARATFSAAIETCPRLVLPVPPVVDRLRSTSEWVLGSLRRTLHFACSIELPGHVRATPGAHRCAPRLSHVRHERPGRDALTNTGARQRLRPSCAGQSRARRVSACWDGVHLTEFARPAVRAHALT